MLAVICAPGYRDIVTTVGQLSSQPVILIDPGHGGMDGGAEAADGTLEKRHQPEYFSAAAEAAEEAGDEGDHDPQRRSRVI